MGAFIVIMIVCVVMAYFGIKAERKRREVWERVAADLGLQMRDPKKLRLTGEIGPTDVTVWTFTRGSGKNRQSYTGYKVTYPSSAPDVRIKRQGGLSFIAKAFGREDIELGDPMFDERVLIETDDPGHLQIFMTAARRAGVLSIFDNWRNAEVRGNSIEIARSGHDGNYDTIVRTLRRLTDTAELMGDAPPRELQDSLEMRRDGDLEAATAQLHEARADRPQDAVNVVEQLIEVEAQVEAAHHDAAAALTREIQDVVDGDEEVDGWRRLAEQPIPSAAPSTTAASLDWRAVTVDLFTHRRGYEVLEHFELEYLHREIRWTGTVRSVREYRFDADFGSDPGVKVTVQLGQIENHRGYQEDIGAVLQLPDGTRVDRGAHISFTGELVRLDRFARNFYVADARLD